MLLKKYRNQLVNIFKLFCFILLVYNSFDILFTYLSFDYNIKLMFASNSFVTELPQISVCTENDVLYDKNKVIEVFKLREEYKEHVRYVDQNNQVHFYFDYHTKTLPFNYFSSKSKNQILKKKYKLNEFFGKYQQIIENELNYEERKEFVVKANQLFECSAKVHFRYDSQQKTIDNCFNEFQVLESISNNKDYGICYTFYAYNKIILKDKDNLKLKIKYEIQKDFIIFSFLNKYTDEMEIIYSDLYFNTYFMTFDDKSTGFREKQMATKVERVGLKADLIIRQTSMQSLSTPYMTYCENDGKYNLTSCLQNCIADLKSNKIIKSLENISLNIDHNISWRRSNMETSLCQQRCPRTCLQTYFSIAFQNIHHTYYEDSVIVVKPTNDKNFLYTAEIDMSLTQCVANIGGLLGLYLGLSLVDIVALLKEMLKKLRLVIKNLIAHISQLKLVLEQMMTILKVLEAIRWKTLFQLMTFPVLISQIFDIFDDYFSYDTQSSFEFVPYILNNFRYSVEDFPFITICNDHILEDIYLKRSFDRSLFEIVPKIWDNIIWNETIIYNDVNNYIEMSKQNINNRMLTEWNKNISKIIEKMSDTYLQRQITHLNLRNIGQPYVSGFKIGFVSSFLKTYAKYFMFKTWNESMIMRQLVEDKNVNGINATLDMLRFYSYHFDDGKELYNGGSTKKLPEEVPLFNVEYQTLSPNGKCLTYKPKEILKNNFTFNVFMYQKRIVDRNFPNYLKQKIFLNSQKCLPIFTNNDNHFTTDWKRNHIILKISKYEFERLGKPYDTHCQQYDNSSQSKCLNDCYIKQYLTRFGCIPNHNKYHTIILDEAFINHPFEFCNRNLLDNITQLEITMQDQCHHKCDVSCFEEVFEAKSELSEEKAIYQIIFQNDIYTKITYIAKITFISLLINIVNTINFWNCTSFIYTLNIFYPSSFFFRLHIRLMDILKNNHIYFYSIIEPKIRVI